MTPRNRRIIKALYIFTIIVIAAFCIGAQRVSALDKQVAAELIDEQAEIDDNEEKLETLNQELKEVDDSTYIEKVAREELGMVDKDTIVFRVKK